MRRVRLSNPELGTGLLPELGLRDYCIVRVILRGAVGFAGQTRPPVAFRGKQKFTVSRNVGRCCRFPQLKLGSSTSLPAVTKVD
eukprot:6484640-Pyramimonas_sp.AAC.1